MRSFPETDQPAKERTKNIIHGMTSPDRPAGLRVHIINEDKAATTTKGSKASSGRVSNDSSTAISGCAPSLLGTSLRESQGIYRINDNTITLKLCKSSCASNNHWSLQFWRACAYIARSPHLALERLGSSSVPQRDI